MKRTMNRLFLRLVMLCVAVILGAIAVAHAQRGLNTTSPPETAQAPAIATQPIPPRAVANSNYGDSAQEQTAGAAGGAYQAPAESPAEWSQGTPAQTYELPPEQFDPPTSNVAEQQPYDPGSYAGSYAAEQGAGQQEYGQQAGYEPEGYGPQEYGQPAETQVVEHLAKEEPVQIDVLPVDNGYATQPAPPAMNDAYPELPPIDTLPATAGSPQPSVEAALPEEHAFAQEPDNLSPPNSEPQPAYTAPPGYGAETPTQNDFGAPAADGSAYGNSGYSDSGFDGAAKLQVNAPLEPTATNSFVNSSAVGSPESNGNGKPGPAELEGPQTPTLSVRKTAPPEIQVGKPAKFQVTVRNIGPVDAHDVLIRDEVPHGTRLIATVPTTGNAADGALLWQMGTIKSGAEVSVSMEVMPMVEGDIGSVATVSFQTSVSARAVATKPQLVLEHTGPGQVLVGESVVFHIKLSNPGSGVATNVTIEEDVPEGLRHTDGRELEYQVGTIRPGETRLLELTLKADKPGVINNRLIARADSNLAVDDQCQLEVVAPMLQVGIEGPGRRYLERRVSFQVRVENPGTAAARNVELVARLPRGLKFVSTNNAGQYNSQEHAVYWSLAELPPQQMGTVELTALPTDMGDQRIRVESRAGMGLTDSAEHNLQVEGLAAMLFTVTDLTDPIEVGGQTTYEVRVLNQGSKVGTNLRLAALIPDGMEPINGEGPSRVTIDGQQVVFEPLARLAPQADGLYKIHVKGTQPGDKRIQVQLVSDDVSEPVTKEESTHVYSDE